MAVKSCKRLFDVRCSRCDKNSARVAAELWAEAVGKRDCDGETRCLSFVAELKTHVRGLVEGWGERLESSRSVLDEPFLPSDVYVPDQQGCLETKRGEGGTLATPLDTVWSDSGLVRRGVAKTKGKFRVVTMQSARVKRVLRPVHNALYDHLTSFSWCVRGDVRREDFLAVSESGTEEIISGDYQAATDNIYLSAVRAIVEVLAEDSRLSEEELFVLRESFDKLRWMSASGVEHPIERGSMMGNLVSFPLLCLLNKACHDIASDCVYGEGERRVGRFNGDDCLFLGSSTMFSKWREVTSRYGLVVNEGKTMRSRRWADLNSQTFDVLRRRLVPKPVLSFLLPSRSAPGELLSSVLSGLSSFRPAVSLLVVNVLMRYEISLRGFTLSNIPSAWCKVLSKKRWFRECVWSGPAEVVEPVYDKFLEWGDLPELPVRCRAFPSVVGPPPRPSALRVVSECCALLARAHTDGWTGVRVRPAEPRLDRVGFRAQYDSPRRPLPRTRFVGVCVRWGFVWPRDLFQLVSERFPWLLLSDSDSLSFQSLPYSPQLVLRHSFWAVRRQHEFPVPRSLACSLHLGSDLSPSFRSALWPGW